LRRPAANRGGGEVVFRHCKRCYGDGTIHPRQGRSDRAPFDGEADLTAIPSRLGAKLFAGGGLHYAWVIAAVTFVVVVLTAGVRSAPGVLIIPLENEFHWSRATISFAVAVNLIFYGMIGPFAAAAMDRFGVRLTMTLSLAATALGVALSPLMHET